jgi:hypothetical protein
VSDPVCGYRPGMAQDFRKGDQVEWDSHGGTAVGKVEQKITSDTEAGGRTVRASKEEPQYLVRSDKSGGTAVHKPEALRKRST